MNIFKFIGIFTEVLLAGLIILLLFILIAGSHKKNELEILKIDETKINIELLKIELQRSKNETH